MSLAVATDFTNALTDFGVTAALGSLSVRGIFDNGYADAFGEIAGSAPSLLCRDEDIAGTARGATLTIGATGYEVDNLIPDGTGFTRLLLSKA